MSVGRFDLVSAADSLRSKATPAFDVVRMPDIRGYLQGCVGECISRIQRLQCRCKYQRGAVLFAMLSADGHISIRMYEIVVSLSIRVWILACDSQRGVSGLHSNCYAR